jgi:parvulin-like peptidyl-prolyl isomerase
MPRKYSSSSSITSITYWRKFAEHRFIYLLIAGVFGFGIIAYFGMGQSGGVGRGGGATRTEQTIATVNGETISRGQYDKLWEQYKRMMGGGELQGMQMQGMVLTGLVKQAVARSVAKARHLTVSDADIDKAVEEFKKQLAGGNKISDQELDERLQLMGFNSLSEFREKQREDLLPKVLSETLTKPVKTAATVKTAKATEADLINSYHDVKFRHVLIDTKKLPEAQAKHKAEQIMAEARSGKDFAALANKYTDDPGNQKPGKFDPKTKKMGKGEPQGGRYDWAPVGKYVPEFGKAMLALKPGEVSPPVKTEFGYHIIKLEGIRATLPKDFDKDKIKLLEEYQKKEEQKAVQIAAQKKQQADQEAQQTVSRLIEDEEKKAKIVWQDPSLEWRYEYALSHPMMSMPQAEKPDFWLRLKVYAAKNPDDSAAAYVLGQQANTRYMLAKKGPEKDKLRKEVIGYYEAALKGSEDQPTRLALAQLYRDAKDNEAALRHYTKLQRILGYDNSTQDKSTHLQLEKAFKELGHPELAEKETKKIALLTIQEMKEAAERKKQADDAKKAAADKGKPGTSLPINLTPGGKATTVVPGSKGTTIIPGGSFTVGQDSKTPVKKGASKDKNPVSQDKKSDASSRPVGKQ